MIHRKVRVRIIRRNCKTNSHLCLFMIIYETDMHPCPRDEIIAIYIASDNLHNHTTEFITPVHMLEQMCIGNYK